VGRRQSVVSPGIEAGFRPVADLGPAARSWRIAIDPAVRAKARNPPFAVLYLPREAAGAIEGASGR